MVYPAAGPVAPQEIGSAPPCPFFCTLRYTPDQFPPDLTPPPFFFRGRFLIQDQNLSNPSGHDHQLQRQPYSHSVAVAAKNRLGPPAAPPPRPPSTEVMLRLDPSNADDRRASDVMWNHFAKEVSQLLLNPWTADAHNLRGTRESEELPCSWGKYALVSTSVRSV